MHSIQRYLNRSGRSLLMSRIFRCISMALLAVSLYLALYFCSILLIRSMSLTWTGLLLAPGLILAALIVAIPLQWWSLRDSRKVAQFVEERHPELELSVRSSLDFIEGRADQPHSRFHEPYIARVNEKLRSLPMTDFPTRPWAVYALTALALTASIWTFFRNPLLEKFYNPSMSFGQTHLDLSEGSITIFEPEYTQVPGRTLPLKSGNFSAYPGSKIRFLVQIPKETRSLFLSQGEARPVPLRINEEGNASHEFVLLENTELQFLISETTTNGRTSPFRFEIKTDEIPEIQLRSHTPEGPLSVMDPLIIESEIKDDFGVKDLTAVIAWKDGEKRIPINVPGNRRKHFLSKSQWYLSDFDLGDAETFSIYIEARDNNPINGPGIGRSGMLTYILESPEKKYDEFMELAKELLGTMTDTLGDNLETTFASRINPQNLQETEAMGKRISNGLYRSVNLTNTLISKVRETPNLTRLDQNFLYQFRNGVSRQARSRSEMSLSYANIHYNKKNASYRNLVTSHKSEEVKVEGLTYELLLQLKMWAVFEMERENNKLQEELDQLESLLENAENMDDQQLQELQEMVEKLMEQIMKDFNEMMMKAAQQMDQNMEEFMNSDAMKESKDMMEELMEKIKEAMEAGDMEKVKELMEQMRAQMEEAYQAMQQQMGEMSPEMQAMMKDMRELMGLLREAKTQEEELEQQTRALKQKMDKEMGGNAGEMNQAKKEEYQKATQKIHDMLSELYNKLVEYKAEDLSENILRQIAEQKDRLKTEQMTEEVADALRRDIGNQERLLDFISRDGMDRLQNDTLRDLEQTEKLQEYLDQGELVLSLESGYKLESFLVRSVRTAERTASRQVREEARPKETFNEAKQELYKILEALQNVRDNMEQERQQFMKAQKEGEAKKLSERQAEIRKMMKDFMDKSQDSFNGTQIEDKLSDISLTMENAEKRLEESRLDGGVSQQQSALQKIGEMMEQLQQSSRPSGGMPMPMSMRQQGQRGDPLLEDIFIPESQKKAMRDKMKDEIRKRLGKNLPEAYGKEIRKYYEKLMDQ